MKLVLVIPPCGFCWDRDAVFEVLTVWNCWASLCPICADRYDSGRAESLVLKTGAADEPLPTAAEARAYVEVQQWTRARPTFRGRPQPAHEYTLLWRSTDPWQQLRVLAFIRETGERRRWGRKFHHYWWHGDYEYWAMPPRETILNRRRLDWRS